MDFPSGSFDKVVAMYLTARQMSAALAAYWIMLHLKLTSNPEK